jgi:hypothetical protein
LMILAWSSIVFLSIFRVCFSAVAYLQDFVHKCTTQYECSHQVDNGWSNTATPKPDSTPTSTK